MFMSRFSFKGEVEIGWEGMMEHTNWESCSWLADQLSLAAVLLGQ